MKRCPACGASYESSKKFCRVDGTVLESSDETPAPPSRWSAAAAPPPPPAPVPLPPPVSPEPPAAARPSAPAAPIRPARGGGRIIAAITIATVFLAALGAVWWYWANPTVTVTNRLVAPVTITMGGMLPLALGPGESATLRVGRSAASAARWQMQSTAPVGGVAAGGVELSGTGALALSGAPFKQGTLLVGLLMPMISHFAPVISNSTRGSICVQVNGRVSQAPTTTPTPGDCDAILPPGAADAFIGYFPLNAGSAVRAVDAQGRGTTFRGIARFVAPVSGRLPVTFDPSHFGGR